jgi:hypothetical protein
MKCSACDSFKGTTQSCKQHIQHNILQQSRMDIVTFLVLLANFRIYLACQLGVTKPEEFEFNSALCDNNVNGCQWVDEHLDDIRRKRIKPLKNLPAQVNKTIHKSTLVILTKSCLLCDMFPAAQPPA